MDEAPAATVTEQRRGRYALLGEIASGGMATVHFGRLSGEGGFAKMFAIKCMHKHLADDPEFRAMFLDEARLAARIQHPNVVATIDVGTSEEGMFLVTEYIAGESLASLEAAAAARGERVDVALALRIIVDVLSGLHAAHIATDENGAPLSIVHRDVSPQNVLVGADGLARVLDFGIAKAAGRSHTTRDGQLKGKLRYMAPEQFRDADVTPATDVYAASVVLWELLTGQRLFAGTNDAAVMARVLEGIVPPPSKLAPEVSAELDAIVARGLARDPLARYASARDMAEALEALPVATSRQVGEWAVALAGDAIRARAAKIAGVNETGTRSAVIAQTSTALAKTAALRPVDSTAILPHPARISTPPPTAGSATRTTPIALYAVAAAFVGALVFFGARAVLAKRANASLPEETAHPSASIASAKPMQEQAPVALPSAASADRAPDSASASAAPSMRVTVRPPIGKPARTTTKASGASCSPPYTEDANGIRRVKPQCL